MRAPAVWLLLAGALAPACGDSPTSPDETTTTALTQSATFQGTLEVHGSSFYSFTSTNGGAFTVTLASLSLVGSRPAIDVPVRVGVGVPRGQRCALAESVELTPALTTQFSTTLDAGTHCVGVDDIGFLSAPAIFVVRFTYT